MPATANGTSAVGVGPRPQRRAVVGRRPGCASRRARQRLQQRADDVRGRSAPAPSTFSSARPSCDASSGASTWTQTRSCVFSASMPVPALGGVVGVEVAGRAGHVDARPAEQHADAADQVHGADDRAALAVDLAANGFSAGARPWPQSQICVAGRLPRGDAGRLTG